MKVKKLKKKLRQRGVSYDGVIEKQELVQKLCEVTPGCSSLHTAEDKDAEIEGLKQDDGAVERGKSDTLQRTSSASDVPNIPGWKRNEANGVWVKRGGDIPNALEQERTNTVQKPSELRLISEIIKRIHVKIQKLEDQISEQTRDNDAVVQLQAVQANFSKQLLELESSCRAGRPEGQISSEGLPLFLWESMGSSSYWVSEIVWVLGVALLVLMNIFIYQVLVKLCLVFASTIRHCYPGHPRQPQQQRSPPHPSAPPIPQACSIPAQAIAGRGKAPEKTFKCIPVHMVSQLKDMGFSNETTIHQALTDANGDVSKAALVLASKPGTTADDHKPARECSGHTQEWTHETFEDLREMGFTDTKANTVALAEAQGNLTLAVKKLVAQERAQIDR